MHPRMYLHPKLVAGCQLPNGASNSTTERLTSTHCTVRLLTAMDADAGAGARQLLRPSRRARGPSRGKLVVRRSLQLGLEWLRGGALGAIVAARALLAEDPIGGVEVGTLVILVDEGFLRRNPSILVLERCLFPLWSSSVLLVEACHLQDRLTALLAL
uniref:Uncharacterized protein n=1 Tax=Arundo donax TaxID=35708 RepID=A0A0A9H3X6_ARUDO